MITGTPAFFEGPQGIRRLEPLAQRLHVDFQTDARFDNPRRFRFDCLPSTWTDSAWWVVEFVTSSVSTLLLLSEFATCAMMR